MNDWKKETERVEKLVKDAEQYDALAEHARVEAEEFDEMALELRQDADDIVSEEIEPTDPDYARELRERIGL